MPELSTYMYGHTTCTAEAVSLLIVACDDMCTTVLLLIWSLHPLLLSQEPSQLDPDPCYYTSLHGLFNVSSPVAAGPTGKPDTPGPQLLLSLPHFCEADARLAAAVDGLSCDPDKHSLYVDVEPITGEGLWQVATACALTVT